MTTKEFHLLKIRIFEDENIVFEGMSEDVPENLSSRQIAIEKLVDKTLEVKLI